MFSGHGSVGGEQVKMKKFGFLRVDLLRGRLWHGQTSTWRNKILALSKKKKKCSLIAICPTLERPSCGKARAATGRRAPKAQNAKPASQRKRIVKDARSMEAAII